MWKKAVLVGLGLLALALLASEIIFPSYVTSPRDAGYIKKIPPDPVSGRTDTSVSEWSDDPKTPGIVGVHSAVESK
jgi:hypothetical protein